MTGSSYPEVVEVLLRAGARPHLRDEAGLTALHYVGNSGARSALDGAAVLCAHGADPDVADEKGENARAESARISAEVPGNEMSRLVSRFLAKGGGCDGLRAKAGARGGVDKDAVAAEVHELRCGAGDAWACGRLGSLYEKGTGVPKDLGRAAKLYENSCDGGHEWGCYALAYAYADGDGVTKDEARALALFEKACDAQYLPGCSQLGYRLEKGQGTKRDDPRAASLYARACEGDEAWACWRLGEAYAAGRGVPADAARASTLRAKACKGGEERACGAKPR
jgi:TPR repeat protein